MKKTLIVISSVLVIIGVFSSASLAQGGGHGHKGKKHSRHAQVWTAKLSPTSATGATGETGSTGPIDPVRARRGHHHGSKHGGSTGATGATGQTGPVGKALFAQNKKKYAVGVHVKGLAASSTFNVAIYKDDVALNPPAIPSITTDANGKGKTSLTGLRSEFGLEKKVSYVVKVTDSTGAVVLSGALERVGHKRHRGGCGNKHGLKGSGGRSKHHR